MVSLEDILDISPVCYAEPECVVITRPANTHTRTNDSVTNGTPKCNTAVFLGYETHGSKEPTIPVYTAVKEVSCDPGGHTHTHT